MGDDLIIRQIEWVVYLFELSSEREQQRILTTEPWFFDKSLVVGVEGNGMWMVFRPDFGSRFSIYLKGV